MDRDSNGFRQFDRRTLLRAATGMVGVSGILAGCTGEGGTDGGPPTTTAALAVGAKSDDTDPDGIGGGADRSNAEGGVIITDGPGGDGDGASGASIGAFQPFARTGVYTFAVGGGETAEDGLRGTVEFDVRDVTGETVDITLRYDVEIAPGEVQQGVGGTFQGELDASGDRGTVIFQLSQFPGGSVIVFAFYPMFYAANRELEVGSEWSSGGVPGSPQLRSRVTGTGSYGGVRCYATEMRRGDGAIVHESCIAPAHGLVAYSAYHDADRGFRTVWIELKDYTPS